MSFRAGLLLGTLVATVSAALLAPRADRSLAAFVVLAGSGALALGPLLSGLAQARPLGPTARALLCGLGFASVPLSVLGALLKTGTHHRPLGAVTFAFGALFIIAGATVVSQRVCSLLESHVSVRRRSQTLRAFGLLAAIGPSFLLARALATPALATGVTDAAIALGTGAVGLWIRWPERAERVARSAGAWVWLAVTAFGAGYALLVGAGPAAAASPVLLAPFGWFLG
jgi:hypothetical protein